ncbi:hypothetical protein O181_118665 [Austropuccinia psidii MF-1]|uniref:Uncharacterized protein n=1 Tax=Austropuccinia psidii MF-1 TaxID=1389203 RepID=A0A9Q3KGU1_9BASI|nr:hypothetical protein [Austropuccinia psidii MF-1]
MVNIDPRLIMQYKDITQQNIKNSKIGIRKSEQDLSKELIQESKEESEYPQHLKTLNPNRKVKKQIQPGNRAIKQVMTAEKEKGITKNEDLIINMTEEISEEINNRQKKHDQKDL